MLLLTNVLLVYSNHFGNDFHFDDLTAVTQNPAIRDPHTIVRAFIDPTLFSVAPEQRNYRPVTTSSLALDLWLAGGNFNVVFFHISTFLWFSAQLVLMFLLFQFLMDAVDWHPSNEWTALAAAAVFAFHPANAETVNYVIQRADLFNSLGCVASLWLFARYPAQRKFGWYLAPAALAMLAKAPALIFPLFLLAYVLLFEQDEVPKGQRWRGVVRAVLPSILVSGFIGWLLMRMQPSTWSSGTVSPFLYRITQPWVALHYFKDFFLPAGLSVDPGWHYVVPLSLQAIAGYVFVVLLLGIAVASARTRRGKPVAFGIFWFFAALLPTSLMTLADVTNDHRMFFPFVGLTLSVIWSVRLALFRATRRLTLHSEWVYAAAIALSLVLWVEAGATRVRNKAWLTEESLWGDATVKNSMNARAWINYGSALFRQGDYQATLTSWQRAAQLDPTCVICQENLIRVYRHLRQDDLAEPHYRKLLEMHPPVPSPYISYAEWLTSERRFEDSTDLLDRAARLYPHSEELKRAHFKLYLMRDAAVRTPLLRALDTDGDTVLSTAEILAAPGALLSLDKNHDGRLSAEECGANFGDESRLSPASPANARRKFMQSNPVLRVLDANHDGEISAAEINNSVQELLSLDSDRNGQLEPSELVPEDILAAARRTIARLDSNRNGKIDASEWPDPADVRLHNLLEAADIDGDGDVTLQELTNEIYYEADNHRDGTVDRRKIDEMGRSGAFEPLPEGLNRITVKPRRRKIS